MKMTPSTNSTQVTKSRSRFKEGNMSEKKWTPGPWADIQGYVTCRGGYNVATVKSHGTYEGKANANLIAAAPDLYEALESLIDAMQHPETDFLCDEIGIARSALAKARGE
jgi:hypothetical protein